MMTAVRGYMYGKEGISGIILCGRQFMNSLADSSLEEIKRAIEDVPFLKEYYEIGEKYIKSRDGRISYAFSGLDRNVASVKSMGRILICWVDEAEPVTNEAFTTLIPTLREEGTDWNAELWVTWNPKHKKAAVERFRASKDPLVKVVEMNYTDNPKFPAKLERNRLTDLKERPDQYPHIWGGDYVTVIEGAYYAASLTLAKIEGRIGRVGPDPLMTLRAYCDIGGTGAKADAFTMWIVQFIGREIRVLDYYEAIGQPFATHLEWLKSRKYTNKRTNIFLPHDGDSNDKVYDVSYASAFRDALYDVTVIPNQGKGAAKARIEAGRRRFPMMWFNAPESADHETTPTCEAGLAAIGWYHEKKDEERNIGLGPEHDWSSHGADSFGMIAVAYEDPNEKPEEEYEEPQQENGYGGYGR
jgi:phage terminase large subunit